MVNPSEEAWRQTARAKIRAVVARERRIALRNLKRLTNYQRSKVEGAISIWHDALEDLERAGEVEFRDRDGRSMIFGDYLGEVRLWVLAARKLKR